MGFLTTKALRIVEGVLLGILATTEITLAVMQYKKSVAAINEQNKIFKEEVGSLVTKMTEQADEIVNIAKEVKEQNGVA